MERLTGAQRAAALAIVAPTVTARGRSAPREAWSPWRDVEAAHGAEVMAELVDLGVIVRWAVGAEVLVTLTPWGAWLLRQQVGEAWRPAEELDVVRDDARPLADPVTLRRRVVVEFPVWEGVDAVRPRPVRRPRYGELGTTLVRLERVTDPRPGPEEEFLRNEEGERVELFAGEPKDEPGLYRGKGKAAGVPVRVGKGKKG